MILEIEIFVFVSEKPRNSLFEETVRCKTLYLCSVTCEIACSVLPSSSNKLFHWNERVFVSNFVYFFLTCSFEVQENLRLLYQTILRQMLGKHAKKTYVTQMRKSVIHSSECTKIVAKLLLHPYIYICMYVVLLLHEISFQSILASLETVLMMHSWQ